MKIHTLTDVLGNPIDFMITPRNANGSQVVVSLFVVP